MDKPRGVQEMNKMPFTSYPLTTIVDLSDRTWPSKTAQRAPKWCSVDLRDGNQALPEPMSVEKKKQLFQLLVQIGFKEIEVGFPAASQTEFDFVRALINENLIPGDVTIQVLTQARDKLIQRTFEALRGAKRAVVHLYVSTSPMQRKVVLCRDKDNIVDLATSHVVLVRKLAAQHPETEWILQFSPESFSQTELDFASRICQEAISEWRREDPEKQIIINLPATVEVCMPNVYADMIEWMSRNLPEDVILSIHPHNDRGTGVAAAEMACLAGAGRVEGTLFGNGERTGNVDLVTLALNLMTQGIDPNLDLSDLMGVASVYKACTGMGIPLRHPYVGDYAFTAFSGSHQDAINKGLRDQGRRTDEKWNVPYLPINPLHIGRVFKHLIRINSQSGKGGIEYVLRTELGIDGLPQQLKVDFYAVVQSYAELISSEVSSDEVCQFFREEYLEQGGPYEFVTYQVGGQPHEKRVDAVILDNEMKHTVAGVGSGTVEAFVNAMKDYLSLELSVESYEERSIGSGSDAQAVAYVSVRVPKRDYIWGVGIDTDTTRAAFLAVLSAINRIPHKG